MKKVQKIVQSCVVSVGIIVFCVPFAFAKDYTTKVTRIGKNLYMMEKSEYIFKTTLCGVRSTKKDAEKALKAVVTISSLGSRIVFSDKKKQTCTISSVYRKHKGNLE